MKTSLAGLSVAILAANGFDEHQMTEIQRALIKAGATTKTIAPETGVMNGWQGNGWGHYFPVNLPIGEALGSDFDMLVIPGGERGIAKLKPNLHTRRIVNHFLEAQKPIAAIEAGVSLLALSPKIAMRDVAAPAAMQDDLRNANANLVAEPMHQDDAILTADGSDITAWVEAALAHFMAFDDNKAEDAVSAAA